jgi:TolB protein
VSDTTHHPDLEPGRPDGPRPGVFVSRRVLVAGAVALAAAIMMTAVLVVKAGSERPGQTRVENAAPGGAAPVDPGDAATPGDRLEPAAETSSTSAPVTTATTKPASSPSTIKTTTTTASPATTPTTDAPQPTTTTTTPPAPVPASLRGKVLFTSNRTAYGHNNPTNIWVMDADGSNARQISDSPTGVSAPDLSPDGTRIVYLDGTSVMTMNADGTNPTQVNKYPATYRQPKWSPDGTRILYAVGTVGVDKAELYTMRPDGSDVVKVFSQPGGAAGGSWSPDGTRLAVVVGDNPYTTASEAALWSVTLTDGKATKVADGSYGTAWSPDGKRIAFSRSVQASSSVCPMGGTPCSEIFTIAADGSDLRQVSTGDPKYQVAPVWSPDGTRLLYTLVSGTSADIYSMRLDGTDVRNLTNTPGSQSTTF